MSKYELPPCVRKTTIGGQAVIEGISMKGPKNTCLAVRKPDGTMDFQERPTRRPHGLWKLPVLRGAYSLFTAMKEGVDDINYSASFFEDEETSEEPSRFEQWVEAHISSDTLEKLILGFAMILGTLLPIVLFLVAPTLIVGFLPAGAPYFVRSLLEGVVRIILFLIFMWSVSHMKDIERTFRYHGAEHKTIFCYEAGLPLTVENVRRMPRFHPRCGTSFMIVMMIIPILIFAFVQMDNVWLRMALRLILLPVVVGLAYECNRFAGRHDGPISRAIRWPGLQMQRLTVFEPDDSMIEVAIAAMQRVIPEDESDKW
ncbi:MAG: DUF1385 domain-containing protein [Butyricicoccus sp.]|nr:DUF1385 domain-containing protein [Butyricicoccus pullicaecorum]MDY5971945.1 DUF1385 domain-containing protein [Butyricicoccus sp.]